MLRFLVILVAGIGLSSNGFAEDPASKATGKWVGNCAMPREGAKIWMGGRETNQLLPLSLDIVAEDREWLFIQGGKIQKADVVTVEDAVPYYQSLLKANPKNVWATAMLGWHYVSEGNCDKARPWLDKALQLDGKNVYVKLALAALHAEEDEYEPAIQQLDEAILIQPDCALAHYFRGLFKAQLSEDEDAMAAYSAAIKICPEYSHAYTGRGALEDKHCKWQEALADFEKALKLNPYDDIALVRRANVRATCSDMAYRNANLAIQDAQKACDITNNEDSGALEVLAAAYAAAGRFADAIKIQTKVVGLTEGGRHFLAELQLNRYRQNKPFKFPPTEEGP